MNWIAEAVVIFVTSLVVIGGPAWWMGRHSKHVPVARLADPASLPYEPPALPRAGRLELPAPNAGAADPSQQLSVIPWDITNAAYALGQHRKDQDEITRQVNVIMLEVELNPETWGMR